MADAITIKALQDASLDAKSLEEVVNGNEVKQVTTRKGETYPSVKKAIKTLFENGGLPATPFKTKALMTASALADGDYAVVTNDTVEANNVLYLKQSGAWVKSAYDQSYKVRLLDTDDTRFIYVGDTYQGSIYVEESSHSVSRYLYLKIPQLYQTRGGVQTGSYHTWSRIMDDIADPARFETRGSTADCLKLNNESLVYDWDDAKFKVIQRSEVRKSKHTNIATSAFNKLIGGEVFEIWLRDKVINSKNSDTQFYTNRGAGVDYTVEEDVANTKLYIKLSSYRIRNALGPTKSSNTAWDKIVADIDDPTLFETSPSGVPDCLVLDSRALVYNQKTDKFSVSPYTHYDYDREILIARSAYGKLTDGLLYNWWNSERVSRLETKAPKEDVGYSFVGSPAPKFISHGGLSALHKYMTFNSALACVEAGKYGYWGIETDMVETKDGEWVMIHDLFLSDYIVGGTGNVIDYTLAELKAMDASRLSNAYGWSDVSMMELSEFLQICVSYNITPFLEFKSVPTNEGIDKVINTVKRFMRIENCIITSLSSAVVQSIRARNKEVPLTYVSLGGVSDIQVQLVKDVGNCVMGVRYNTSDADRKKLHDAGIRYTIWTVPQSYIDSGGINGASYVLTDEGIPHNFDKGILTLNYKSGDDFAGLTSAGTSTVSNKILKLTAGKAYLDIDVADGDVINVSFEARHTSGGDNSYTRAKIQSYSASNEPSTSYTHKDMTGTTFKMHSLAALNHIRGVTKIRVEFESTTTSSVEIRGLRVQKREV